MSVTRACLPCRATKTKCDLVRPTCGRCTRRGLACSGFPSDAGFIFRGENEAARRNSERARRQPRENPVLQISSDLIPVQEQQTQGYTNVRDPILHQLYSWLNDRALRDIPNHLQEDLESRAVDRFFVNWTLYPSNDGVLLGFMHYLPTLYLIAPPGSILWLAVRTLAFADLRHQRTGDSSFLTKTLEYYGAALTLLKTLADDEQSLGNGHVLAAILLIDNFESMYLGRTEPLGPHRDAVRQILRTGGNEQLFDQSRFSLWLVAHNRLQALQVLLREEPEPEQMTWLNKLNIDSVPLHIFADIQRMTGLAAAAKKLTLGSEIIGDTPWEKVEQARKLAQAIQDFLTVLESWTTATNDAWRPKAIDPQADPQVWKMDDNSNLPTPQFVCPRLFNFHDIWLAYNWNSHAAGQIVLRESLIDIINYIAELEMQQPDPVDMERIQAEQDAVHRLSGTLIRSFPQLLGFVYGDTREPYFLQQGKMAGRFFALFSMSVVQWARFTSPEHKQTASEVIQWIHSSHSLG